MENRKTSQTDKIHEVKINKTASKWETSSIIILYFRVIGSVVSELQISKS